MFRSAWKPLFVGAIAVAAIAGSAMKADAWWRAYCRPVAYSYCYSTPCYTTSYCYSAPCYTASDCGTCGYYLGYRPGPLRRLLFGRYRWYYGCWTTPCCYDVSYSPVVTPTVAMQSQAGQPKPAAKPAPSQADTAPAIPEPTDTMPTIIDQPRERPAPAQPDMEPEVPTPDPVPNTIPPMSPPAAAPGFDFNPLESSRPNSSYVPRPSSSALISVWVPYDAKVIVNGHVTESKGSRRQFVSYGLQSGYSYKYEIKAQLVRDGKILEDVRTVTLTAGEDTSVAFGFQSIPSQSLASQW